MNTNNSPSKINDDYAKLLNNIIYDREIMNCIFSYLNEDMRLTYKKLFKRSGLKEKKKQIKDIIKIYIEDFGKHQEKIKYRISNEGSLIINTSIFNVNKNYLKDFITVYHEASNDEIDLEKEELYEYLRVLPKFEFYLKNTKNDCLKVSKALIPYENLKNNDEEDDDTEKKKYEMFYEMSDLNLGQIDFSDPEQLKERQKKILEIMNEKNNKIFYPLEFICNVNYWSIILCHGGYFAAGFFLREKVLEHKSDHKYVVRKKAGQRQLNKDKSKKIKNSVILIIKFEDFKNYYFKKYYLI
jgi:hypothetical protein